MACLQKNWTANGTSLDLGMLYSSSSMSYAHSLPSSGSGIQESSPSFERLEIHSSFTGSGAKIRRENFEVYHRTPSGKEHRQSPEKCAAGRVGATQEPKEGLTRDFVAGARELGLSLQVRDIPWLDEDEEEVEHQSSNLGKAQRIKLLPGKQVCEKESPIKVDQCSSSDPVVPAVRLPETKACGSISARHRSSSPCKRASWQAEVQTARTSRVESGSPVTFYIEGRPQQCFGRVRSIDNGTYTVDVIGGGRKAGLDAVTLCSELDLQKAQISKSRAFHTKLSPRPSLPRTVSTPELSPLEVGTPVAFFAQNKTFYGRVRSVHEGVYSVDVAGGGIKVGLNSVTPCSEEKLEKVVLSKKALVWHLDAWSGYKTRNAAQPQLRPERWASVGRKCNRTPRQASQEPHRRAVPTWNGVAIAKASV